MLADTPPSVGLPEVAGSENEAKAPETGEEFKAFVREKVFTGKQIYLAAGVSKRFVYAIRYAVFLTGAPSC